MNVLVFQTNINSDERIHRVACRLCKLQARCADAVCKWSIDLEDCDNVLRIETKTLTETDVIRLLTNAGLQCTPLN